MNPDKSHKLLVRYFAKSTKDNDVTFFKLWLSLPLWSTLKEKKGNMEILEYWSVPLLSNSIFTHSLLPIVIYLTGSKMKKVFSPFDFVEGWRWESGEGHD